MGKNKQKTILRQNTKIFEYLKSEYQKFKTRFGISTIRQFSKHKTLLEQNTQLFEFLKSRYAENKTRFGIFKIRQFSQAQMDRIVHLDLDRIQSLDGIEELKNLNSLSCQIKGEIDYDSYTRAFKLENLKDKSITIYSTRDLQGMDLSQLDDKCMIYDADMSGRYSKEEILQINTKLDEIKASLNENMSEYKKVESIYLKVGNIIEYDDESIENGTNTIRTRSLAGCLLDRKGVCAGYAKTLKTVLNDNGIDAISCGGDGKGNSQDIQSGDHQWNQVKVNGYWYNCDLTFDAASDKEKFNRKEWENFLKSDQVFSKNHTKDPTEKQHECISSRYDALYFQPEFLDTRGLTREQPKMTQVISKVKDRFAEHEIG